MGRVFDFFGRNKPYVFLAPMDGYTDSAYRQIIKKINPEVICITEFHPAEGIIHFQPSLLQSKLSFCKEEQPLIIQLFGKDIKSFVKAVKIVESLGFSGIDINMGCPAKKIIHSGHGGGLLKEKTHALEIVKAVRDATSLPISVKTRLGRNSEEELIPFICELEKIGIQFVTIHGRTVKQGFTGKANLSPLYTLKSYTSLPIIANGDIVSYDDGIQKLKNLDGFMIGRASFGNPWCFLPNNRYITPHKTLLPGIFQNRTYFPTLQELLDMLLLHISLLVQTKGEKKGILDARKHICQYLKGIPNISSFRKEMVLLETYDEVKYAIENIQKHYEEYLSFPLCFFKQKG